MIRTSILLPVLARLVSASISLATFTQPNCGGDISNNIRSNPANRFESSECVATNQFSSVGVITADPGFKCNIYSDRACANFLQSFATPGECGSVIGSGVICFSQKAFDNPLDGASGQLLMGAKFVTVVKQASELIQLGVSQACTNVGCDPTNTFSETQNPMTSKELVTVSVAGNYDNTQQRDYMRNVLQEAFRLAQSGDRDNPHAFLGADPNNPTIAVLENPFIHDIPTFAQVVLNDAQGATLAELKVTITQTDTEKQQACEDSAGKITGAALGAIPVIGGVAGLAFAIGCSAS
ncbi:hypothetical protein PV04_09372 [Phialophora macrospora]|uniref:Uncharacterized protein n=1 Tax=Phialophora macrospora TaxID=1851006 RepID=A0A0D2FC70_9EURO|nr:hypothetical protein PV04_09372 [Phialophora macrospora]